MRSRSDDKLFFKDIETPVGRLKLVATEEAVVALLWEKEKVGRVRLGDLEESAEHPMLLRAETQLGEYFSGSRRVFDLAVEPRGTDFQKKVWEALRLIPFGSVQSYGELARSLGFPKASRAVGAANGRNPVCIIIPCHRVIGANGRLTGFAGGLGVKQTLLKLEGRSF